MARNIWDRVYTPENIAIATSTFYKLDDANPVIRELNFHRAELATEFIKTASKLEYAVLVVDGGSPKELVEKWEKYALVIPQDKGTTMGYGRRQAVAHTKLFGRPIIAWVEPEKTTLIPELWKAGKMILEGKADLVIPNRISLDSYPYTQQPAETFGNKAANQLIGRKEEDYLDFWFGPRVWANGEITNYFLSYNGLNHRLPPKCGEKEGEVFGDKWDSIFMFILDAIKNNKKVVGVPVNYTHPKAQTDFENGNGAINLTWKRLDQLNNLLPALKTYWERLNAS